MPNPQNIIPPKKGEIRNPKGRPKKFLTTLRADGYTKSQVADTYKVLLSLTMVELKGVYEDATATILERTVANAIRKDFEKGVLDNIESVLGRAYGAPKQELDINQMQLGHGGKIEESYEDIEPTEED